MALRYLGGSENNLVDRFYCAAKIYGAHEIVRVCADNPFILASEIDRLVVQFRASHADYGYNHVPVNNLYSNGLGGEYVLQRRLKEYIRPNLNMIQKEHVFNYVWDNKSLFDIMTIDPLEPCIRDLI